MTDRGDRSDRLRKRFEDDDTDSADQRDGANAGDEERDPRRQREGESVDGSEESGADGDTASVKDRPSVLMYLPEDTRQDLDIRFDELNARYKREHGEPLEKNRDYYPAVIRAGLTDRTVEDVLGL